MITFKKAFIVSCLDAIASLELGYDSQNVKASMII